MQLPPVPRCPRLPWFEPGSESSSATMPPLATGLWAPLRLAWPRGIVVLSESPRRTGPALVRRGVLPDPRSQQRLGYNDLGRPSKNLVAVLTQSPAASPRLHHCDVLLKGAPPPWLPSGRSVWCFPNSDGGGGRGPYASPQRARSAVAAARLTVLPCGPRSVKASRSFSHIN